MNKKIISFLCGFTILSAFIIWNLKFKLYAIIPDPDHAQIIDISYVSSSKGDIIRLDNYDSIRILMYLHSCKEKKSVQKSKGYMIGDYDLIITVSSSQGIKQILLGRKHSYSTYGHGTTKYVIVNSERILTDLLDILNIQDALFSTSSALPRTSSLS